jgi:hypothetical protein
VRRPFEGLVDPTDIPDATFRSSRRTTPSVDGVEIISSCIRGLSGEHAECSLSALSLREWMRVLVTASTKVVGYQMT